MKKIIILIVAIFLVSGCAHLEWKKQDGTEVIYSDWIKDYRQCYTSSPRVLLEFIPFYPSEQNYFLKCMKEKGYRKNRDEN